MAGPPDPIYPLAGKRVWIVGHGGMVGSALARRLDDANCTLLTVSRDDLDLRRQSEVEAWVNANKPQAIFMAAGTVGGIAANASRPAEFIYDNGAMVTNVVEAAYQGGVEKLLVLGSSCIYPRLCDQPMHPDMLLSGALEPTNEWYALAKLMGFKLCQAYRSQYGCDFITAIPANLYGPGDDFDLESGHVVAALLRKTDAALTDGDPVTIWGSGEPVRDFLYVDDAADALLFLMQHYSDDAPVNIGSGAETSIRELAEAVGRAAGFAGDFEFDRSKPDGMPRKRLDASHLADLGWEATTGLDEGLSASLAWYRDHKEKFVS